MIVTLDDVQINTEHLTDIWVEQMHRPIVDPDTDKVVYVGDKQLWLDRWHVRYRVTRLGEIGFGVLGGWNGYVRKEDAQAARDRYIALINEEAR